MPGTIEIDEFGIANFRKSLYDEEGDAINVLAAEVVEVDGEAVAEGAPERTPGWLQFDTVSEETAEGPLESRRYLHLDFAIDTDHAEIDKNRSYRIRITASDNFNDPQPFEFVYTNGILDFSTITGLTGHFARRLQGTTGSTSTLINYGTGGNLGGSWGTNLSDGNGRGSFSNSNSSGGSGSTAALLPSDSADDPFSIFLIFRATNNNLTANILEQGSLALRMNSNGNSISLLLSGDGVLRQHTQANAASNFTLVEIHKGPDQLVKFLTDGVQRANLLHDAPVGDSNFVFGASSFRFLEFLVIDGELSESQKTNIRRALKSLYPHNTPWVL